MQPARSANTSGNHSSSGRDRIPTQDNRPGHSRQGVSHHPGHTAYHWQSPHTRHSRYARDYPWQGRNNNPVRPPAVHQEKSLPSPRALQQLRDGGNLRSIKTMVCSGRSAMRIIISTVSNGVSGRLTASPFQVTQLSARLFIRFMLRPGCTGICQAILLAQYSTLFHAILRLLVKRLSHFGRTATLG